MADPTDVDVSNNGSALPVDDREAAFAVLRTTPENVHLFRGYGPLVVGIILFILMVTLAPSVAPEHVVEEPVNETTTTSVVETTP